MEMETRKVFKNDFIEEIWTFRLNSIVSMLHRLEIESVKEGLRGGAFVSYSFENLQKKMEEYHELKFIPISKMKKTNSYSITSSEPKPLEPFDIRCLVVREDNKQNYLKEIKEGNMDNILGEVLGYPECCIKAFNKYWNEEGKRDFTFEQAMNTTGAEIEGTTVTLPKELDIDSNGLLRWFGVRTVFHMPCSFDCEESKKIYKGLKELALSLGYTKEIKWLEEALNWEIKWSALHGIGILTTPVAKVRFSTDYTPDEKLVIKKGTSSVDYKDTLWKENGFSNYRGMEYFHEPVEKLVYSLNPKSIVDFGCGNGYLMTKFEAEPYGIDCNPEAIRTARQVLFPEYEDNFSLGDISDFNFKENYDLAMIAAGRLIEMDKETRLQFIKDLIENSNKIIISAYSDWLDMYGSLENMADKLGFTIIEKESNDKSSAAVVRWKQ